MSYIKQLFYFAKYRISITANLQIEEILNHLETPYRSFREPAKGCEDSYHTCKFFPQGRQLSSFVERSETVTLGDFVFAYAFLALFYSLQEPK